MADDHSLEAMQSLAADFDAGKLPETAAPATAPTEEMVPPPEKVVEQEAPAKKKAPNVEEPEAKDESASSLKKTPEAPKAEDKPKSKWAQNEERKNKSWETINAEKEALRKEREEFQREREELKKQSQSASSFRDDKGFSAADYEQAAKTYATRGESDMAEAAKARALEVRQAENKARSEAEMEEGRKKWAATYVELSEKHPELKVVGSPAYNGVLKILQDRPHLQRASDGLKDAVRLYHLEKAESEVAGLRGEKTKLQQELEKLQKKLSPSSGTPPEPLPGQKSKSDMTDNEQREEMQRLAEKIDQEAGFA